MTIFSMCVVLGSNAGFTCSPPSLNDKAPPLADQVRQNVKRADAIVDGEIIRISGYDEIAYCDALDARPNELRYALTKELMHVFDSKDQLVDTSEKFVQLLREIQNQPMPAHASRAFASELDTRWMAAVILCPKRFRDECIEDYRSGKLQNFDIAEKFRLPEWVVPFVMDDYYNTAHDELIG